MQHVALYLHSLVQLDVRFNLLGKFCMGRGCTGMPVYFLHLLSLVLDDLPKGLGWMMQKSVPLELHASHNSLSVLRFEGFGAVPTMVDMNESVDSLSTLVTIESMSSVEVAEVVEMQVQ